MPRVPVEGSYGIHAAQNHCRPVRRSYWNLEAFYCKLVGRPPAVGEAQDRHDGFLLHERHFNGFCVFVQMSQSLFSLVFAVGSAGLAAWRLVGGKRRGRLLPRTRRSDRLDGEGEQD
jgi:hypothetical protein